MKDLKEIINLHNKKYSKAGRDSDRIVIYPGRFQPFSKHHKQVYEWAVNEYGGDNVYIVTSDSVGENSPFNFDVKRRIIEASGVPPSKIIKEKRPYAPNNLAALHSDKVGVFILGEKDAGRLKVGIPKKDGSERYFRRYVEGRAFEPIRKGGYVVIAPNVDVQVEGIGRLDGTLARRYMSSVPASRFGDVLAFDDIALFEEIKGLLPNAVAEVIARLFSENDAGALLEYNSTGGAPLSFTAVDDGPRAFIGNKETYQSQSDNIALRLGFSVVNWILDPSRDFEYHDSTEPPKGPYDPSYFPSGVPDDGDYSDAERLWDEHTINMADLIGYRIVNYIKTGR